MPDRSQAMVQGPETAEREAEAALERVGHPMKLFLQALSMCAERIAESLGS